MIFHLALNCLLTFILMAIAVETVLALFQVNHARLRMICRSIPLVKMPLDMIFFAFIQENGFVNFNPFSCEYFTHDFLMSFFHGNREATAEHFIVPTYIASFLPPFFLHTIAWLIGLISLLLLGYHLLALFKNYRSFQCILQTARPFKLLGSNAVLVENLNIQKVQLLVSDQIAIPCAIYKNTIVFPERLLSELSPEERDAVVAHELEHLMWNDPCLKALLTLISAFFWWIPSKAWQKKIDADCEQASDSAVTKYGIEREALASALIKIVKLSRNQSRINLWVCSLINEKNQIAKRVQELLTLQATEGVIRLSLVLSLCVGAYLFVWAC